MKKNKQQKKQPKVSRKVYGSGMVRDVEEGKIDYDRIYDGPLVDRYAKLLTDANNRYPDVEPGKPNWILAKTKEEMIRFRKSAARHFRQWMRQDEDFDHFAATLFNMNGYEMVKEKLNGKR